MQAPKSSSGILSTFTFYFGAIMIAVYFSLGLTFLFSNLFTDIIAGSSRIILGVIIIAYASLRAYLLYRSRKKISEQKQ